MPRPRKCRRVYALPENRAFAPQTPGQGEPVILTVDEYETLRLIDHVGYSQDAAGAYMGVGRTTVQQIYTAARKKLAAALVEGLPIRIEGGAYELCRSGGHCRWVRQGETPEGGNSMIVAICVDEDRESTCPVFARAPFLLVEQDGVEKFVENPGAAAQSGAGLQAAQAVVDTGAAVLITRRCGENAAAVFAEAGVEVYKAQASDARENLRLYHEGRLEKMAQFHPGFQGIQ